MQSRILAFLKCALFRGRFTMYISSCEDYLKQHILKFANCSLFSFSSVFIQRFWFPFDQFWKKPNGARLGGTLFRSVIEFPRWVLSARGRHSGSSPRPQCTQRRCAFRSENAKASTGPCRSRWWPRQSPPLRALLCFLTLFDLISWKSIQSNFVGSLKYRSFNLIWSEFL